MFESITSSRFNLHGLHTIERTHFFSIFFSFTLRHFKVRDNRSDNLILGKTNELLKRNGVFSFV
jgi:hypothetical protein